MHLAAKASQARFTDKGLSLRSRFSITLTAGAEASGIVDGEDVGEGALDGLARRGGPADKGDDGAGTTPAGKGDDGAGTTPAGKRVGAGDERDFGKGAGPADEGADVIIGMGPGKSGGLPDDEVIGLAKGLVAPEIADTGVPIAEGLAVDAVGVVGAAV